MDADRRTEGVPGAPSIRPRLAPPPAQRNLRELFARELDSYTYYAYGKVALRDGIRFSQCPHSGNVLLPAFLPGGIVEPLYELGLEPRFYAIDSDLGPDIADLEERIDRDSVAVMVVHYFGFPQPRFDDVLELAEDRQLFVIDDNAHSPFSRRGARLLGTFGDIGLTSFRKTLPLPDGALLIGRTVPESASPLAGHAPWLSPATLRHLAGKALTYVRYRTRATRRVVNALLSLTKGSRLGPKVTYELSKVPMSALAWQLTKSIDPRTVVMNRRAAFRAWRTVFAGQPGVSMLYDTLPEGVCPQVVPLVCESSGLADRFIRAMDAASVGGVHTWPDLREPVKRAPAYETATSMAARLVTVPCHQQLSPEMVSSVAPDVVSALNG